MIALPGELAGILLEVVVDDLGLDLPGDGFGGGGEEEVRAYLESRDGGLDVGEGRSAAHCLDGLGHLLGGFGLVDDDYVILNALLDEGIELVELGSLIGAGIHELEFDSRLGGEDLEVGRVGGDKGLIQVADKGADYRLGGGEDATSQDGQDEGDNDEFLHKLSPLRDSEMPHATRRPHKK